MGNANDMTKAVAMLNTTDEQIADIYAKKTGKSRDAMMKLMSDETLLTGKTALEAGFVDKLIDGDPVHNFTWAEILNMKQKLAAMNSLKNISAPMQGADETKNKEQEKTMEIENKALLTEQAIKITELENKVKAERASRIESAFNTLASTRPTLNREEWLPKCLADESVLNLAAKFPESPIAGNIATNATAPHIKVPLTNGDDLWKEASKIENLVERTHFVRNEINGKKSLRFAPFNANTLGGTEITRIAQMTLDYLAVQMRPLNAFTTDFSSETAQPGKVITSRFVTQPSTADFSSSKAVVDVTTTARSITLDKYRGVSLGFTDLERTYTDVQMQDMFIKPSVVAIYEHIMGSLFALVLNANYSSSVVSTAANTDADDIADYASTLSTAKCPTTDRSLILSSAYYANLAKDNAIQAAYAYGGSEAIRENRIPRVHGFDVFEYTGTIPTNSENLGSIALHKSALLIASRRVVPPQAGTWYGNVQSATDPESGLTVDVRTHYDGTNQVLQTSLLYGVAVGHGAALVRIKTA
jgi:hypothetical protein